MNSLVYALAASLAIASASVEQVSAIEIPDELRLYIPDDRIELPAFPPGPIKDLTGNELDAWTYAKFSCSASWDEYCEDSVRVDVGEGFEYCSHNFHVTEWNNAKFQVTEVTEDHVTVWFRVQGGSFLDRYGGNIAAYLIVGMVGKGSYSPDICLPRRRWAVYAHGNMGGGFYNDHCATLPAFEVPFDQHCSSLEANPVPRDSISSAPCTVCDKDPRAPPPPAAPPPHVNLPKDLPRPGSLR